jgi:replicative superfamily II helicase
MQTIHPEAIDYLISVDRFSDFNGAQKDILNNGFMDYSSNYIVATNTGTGKTALAQLRIVDTLKKGQKVIFISPYKSIAEEKRQDFEYYNKYGWSCISSANPNETKDNIDYSNFNLISMTYEKFDSVLNNIRFVNGWLKRVGLLVVDEAHMISDIERGPTLESSITKVITMFDNKIRILLLSAVLPNVESVAKWINAKYGTSNWRPVDLEVGFALFGSNSKSDTKRNPFNLNLEKKVKSELKPGEILVKYGSLDEINKIIYKSNLRNKTTKRNKEEKEKITTNTQGMLTYDITPLSPFEKISNKNTVETDLVIASLNSIYKVLEHELYAKDINNPLWFLSEQTIKENGQVLIFTTDRSSTESLASSLAFLMNNSKNFHKYLSTNDIVEIENNYISKMKLKDDKLIAVMKSGVAFHHAGLDLQKRKLVEDAYKSGKIKILLSTTTLIAGVNLPATLVIFDSLSFWNGTNKQMMAKRDFLNGCGRAGRPGYETRGRALIMTSSLPSAIQFIARPLEKVESQFTLDTLVFQTLSIIKRNADIGHKFTMLKDINNFFIHSFYFSCGFKIDSSSYLKQLLDMDMIIANKNSSNVTNNAPIKEIITDMDETKYNDIRKEGNTNTNSDIDQSNGISYCITKLGYETIKFYLNPRTGYLIRNMLFALESYFSKSIFNSTDLFMRISIPKKFTIFSIIHTLMHAKELQNQWKTIKSKEKEIEVAKNHSNEIMINRTMYLNEKLTEEERKCLGTTMAFYDKLNMDDLSYRINFEYLYQRFGRGDFSALQENMEWLIGATLRIAQVILIHNAKALNEITNILIILLKRINAGMVKEELLELCTIREIGRIRSFALANAGINSIKQLINPNNKWTITNILESNQLAERIIENTKKFKTLTASLKGNNHFTM